MKCHVSRIILWTISFKNVNIQYFISSQNIVLPTGGLEPPIFGLGDRRLIHWATRAAWQFEKT